MFIDRTRFDIFYGFSNYLFSSYSINMDCPLLNPYHLLGVSIYSTIRELKKSYYSLSLLCHPDKGGSDKDMDIIHKAYLYIKQQLHNNDKTITCEEAEAEFEDFCKEQESKPPPFSKIYEDATEFLEDFNETFEKEQNEKNGWVPSPFRQGYGHLMERSEYIKITPDKNDTELELDTDIPINETLTILRTKSNTDLHKPLKHIFSKKIIVYENPEKLPNTYGTFYQLGIKNIDDYSEPITKQLMATDYRKAFMPRDITSTDIVSSTLLHRRKTYSNLDELIRERQLLVFDQ